MKQLTRLTRSLIARYGIVRRRLVRGGPLSTAGRNAAGHHLVRLDAHAGARLRELIEHAGLAPERLAARTGCSISYLEGVFAGTRPWVHPDVLRELARELRSYPAWIAHGALDPGATLGSRILELRRRRGFSQKTVVEKMREVDGVGLHETHLRRIEKGLIQKPRDETLATLASVLGVSTNFLLYGSDDPPPAWPFETRPRRARPRGTLTGAAVLAFMVVLVVVDVGAPTRRNIDLASLEVRVTHDAHRIEAFDPLSNRTEWFKTFAARVLRHEELLWNNVPVVLVGLDQADIAEAGGFFVYGMADGRPIVSDLPDEDERVERVRLAGPDGGQRTFLWKRYDVPRERLQADIDNDGENELIVPFEDEHQLGPARLRVYGTDGAVRGTYYATGNITYHLPEDVDGDGKAEILLCTTSRDPARRGFSVVVLDDEHMSGVTRDALDDPYCQLKDGSLAAVTFPPFDEPYMRALGAPCLKSWEVQLLPPGTTGGARFVVWFGGDPDYPAILYLDAALTPVNVTGSDAIQTRLRQVAGELAEPFVKEHLTAWSRHYQRFGAARVDAPDASVRSPESDDAPGR